MARRLPSGTVTFLFTDIEGSTRLLAHLGPDAYAEALAEHRRVLRDGFSAHGGVEVDTQGDAFFIAFPTAEGAVAAAESGQASLLSGRISVRMGLHTGAPTVTSEGYVGIDVHRGARIAALAHGGQVILSAATAALTDRPFTTSAATGSRTSTPPPTCSSSETSNSLRCGLRVPSTSPPPRRSSWVASQSSSRPRRPGSTGIRACSR